MSVLQKELLQYNIYEMIICQILYNVYFKLIAFVIIVDTGTMFK